MPSLDDLKKRITSIKSTQKITKAMKMVAAAKLKRAQENAEKGRPFSEKMNNIILNLSNSISDKDNASKFLVGTGKDSTHLCVVITADRGLCGGFNTNIINYIPSISKYGQSFQDEIVRTVSSRIFKVDVLSSSSRNLLARAGLLPFVDMAIVTSPFIATAGLIQEQRSV